MIPKFRAWLKEENKMIIVDTMNWFDDEFESIGMVLLFSVGRKKLNLCFPRIRKTNPEKKSLKGMFFRLITLKLLYVLDNTAIMITLVRTF